MSERFPSEKGILQWSWDYSLPESQFASGAGGNNADTVQAAASTSGKGSSGKGAVLVDAHVHLHPCFELTQFLHHAARNFRQAAVGLGLPMNSPGVLLFTESAGVDQFENVRQQQIKDSGGWQVQSTGESESVLLRHEGQPPLVLVAGRQIVAREGIEVLALGTTCSFPDGRSAESTLETVMEAGAVPVLPWGFGKWWGRRGRLVQQLLFKDWPAPLFLGDNGGRLWGGPRPRLFGMAEAIRIPVLPGTDPYPFPRQVNKVGRYGFMMPYPMHEQTPWATLAQWLRGKPARVPVFGRLETLPRFIWDQFAMQMHKARRKRPR